LSIDISIWSTLCTRWFTILNTTFVLFQINEFVKRARAAKIHAYIMSHLKKEMPALMGKSKTQQKLIQNLDNEFEKVYFSTHLRELFYISDICLTLNVHLWHRSRKRFVYQQAIFRVLIILGKFWVITTSPILKNWSLEWFKLWMICLAMTFLSFWRTSEILMNKKLLIFFKIFFRWMMIQNVSFIFEVFTEICAFFALVNLYFIYFKVVINWQLHFLSSVIISA